MAEFLTSWLDISRQPKLNPNTELKVKDIIRREVTLTYYFVRPSVRPSVHTYIHFLKSLFITISDTGSTHINTQSKLH